MSDNTKKPLNNKYPPKSPPVDSGNNKRIAILIDADNVTSFVVPELMNTSKVYGDVVLARAYADWQQSDYLLNWDWTCLNYSIEAVQQFAFTKGKNATDIRLSIDAMSLAYEGLIDGFVIASSDSDFTPLIMALRQRGFQVFGFGRSITHYAFKRSCNKFVSYDCLPSFMKRISEPQKIKIAEDVRQRELEQLEMIKQRQKEYLERINQEGEINDDDADFNEELLFEEERPALEDDAEKPVEAEDKARSPTERKKSNAPKILVWLQWLQRHFPDEQPLLESAPTPPEYLNQNLSEAQQTAIAGLTPLICQAVQQAAEPNKWALPAKVGSVIRSLMPDFAGAKEYGCRNLNTLIAATGEITIGYEEKQDDPQLWLEEKTFPSGWQVFYRVVPRNNLINIINGCLKESPCDDDGWVKINDLTAQSHFRISPINYGFQNIWDLLRWLGYEVKTDYEDGDKTRPLTASAETEEALPAPIPAIENIVSPSATNEESQAITSAPAPEEKLPVVASEAASSPVEEMPVVASEAAPAPEEKLPVVTSEAAPAPEEKLPVVASEDSPAPVEEMPVVTSEAAPSSNETPVEITFEESPAEPVEIVLEELPLPTTMTAEKVRGIESQFRAYDAEQTLPAQNEDSNYLFDFNDDTEDHEQLNPDSARDKAAHLAQLIIAILQDLSQQDPLTPRGLRSASEQLGEIGDEAGVLETFLTPKEMDFAQSLPTISNKLALMADNIASGSDFELETEYRRAIAKWADERIPAPESEIVAANNEQLPVAGENHDFEQTEKHHEDRKIYSWREFYPDEELDTVGPIFPTYYESYCNQEFNQEKLQTLRPLVYCIIKEHDLGDGWAAMSDIERELKKIIPDFKPEEYDCLNMYYTLSMINDICPGYERDKETEEMIPGEGEIYFRIVDREAFITQINAIIKQHDSSGWVLTDVIAANCEISALKNGFKDFVELLHWLGYEIKQDIQGQDRTRLLESPAENPNHEIQAEQTEILDLPAAGGSDVADSHSSPVANHAEDTPTKSAILAEGIFPVSGLEIMPMSHFYPPNSFVHQKFYFNAVHDYFPLSDDFSHLNVAVFLEVKELLYQIIHRVANNEGWALLNDIEKMLKANIADFSPDHYGFPNIMSMLKTIGDICLGYDKQQFRDLRAEFGYTPFNKLKHYYMIIPYADLLHILEKGMNIYKNPQGWVNIAQLEEYVKPHFDYHYYGFYYFSDLLSSILSLELQNDLVRIRPNYERI